MSNAQVPQSSLPAAILNTNVIWDWTAHIQYDQYELGTSFNICVFLGAVPEDPEEWLVSSNMVGKCSAHVQSSPHGRQFRKTEGKQDPDAGGRGSVDFSAHKSEGFVGLNVGISKFSEIRSRSFDPEFVVPYLTNNMHWRIQKKNGDVAQLESLEVVVLATPMTIETGGMFPVPGEARRFNGITYGRQGGSREN